MPFPQFEGKYAGKPMLNAVEGMARRKMEVSAESIVLCYQPSAMEYGVKAFGGKRIHGFYGEVYSLKRAGDRILMAGNFGIGAPVVAVMLETMAALGVRKCITVGIAGVLRGDIACGEIMIARAAIRDEGTSHHYAPSDQKARASLRLSARLKQQLGCREIQARSGVVWTTDAPYRETVEEVRHYQQAGVMAVEMEAAALFIVSAALGMEAACGLVAADSLADGVWKPITDSGAVKRSLQGLVDASVEALLA